MGQFQKRARLNEQQLRAVEILSAQHGKTYEEIAEEVGVTGRTLYNWRATDLFNDELKRAIVRNTHDDLPAIFESIAGHIIRDGNAALFKVLLQANGMLTDKQEITQINGQPEGRSIDDMRADIERFKNRLPGKPESGE